MPCDSFNTPIAAPWGTSSVMPGVVFCGLIVEIHPADTDIFHCYVFNKVLFVFLISFTYLKGSSLALSDQLVLDFAKSKVINKGGWMTECTLKRQTELAEEIIGSKERQ